MFKPFKSFKTVVVAGLAAILMLPGSARAGEARADWQAEWEKTVQAAKREGKLRSIFIRARASWALSKYLDLDVPGKLEMKPIVDVIEEALGAIKK
jgi:hypothetical protein